MKKDEYIFCHHVNKNYTNFNDKFESSSSHAIKFIQLLIPETNAGSRLPDAQLPFTPVF